jgi:hypothetical protein
MFLFYHHEQDEKNVRYYKGKLFEKLLADYLNKNGYDVKLRQKHNSLEYDLEGIDKTTGIKIIGEAKAHSDSIDGQTISAFVGKIIPLGLLERKVHGLFLSTSSLTPEAQDYYRSVSHFGINSYTGKELFDKIIESLDLPDNKLLNKKMIELKYNPIADFILTTDFGYFRLVIISANDTVTPSHFLVYNQYAELLTDSKFLKNLQNNIKELSSLEPIYGEIKRVSDNEYRTIQEGLLLGKDWTDYRLPAGPQFYVGRTELIEQIISIISKDNCSSHVLQIKSRSGVGKSSTLALIAYKYKELSYNVELHDARDIKSVLDIYSIVRRFTNSSKMPQDFTEVEEQLTQLAKNDKNTHIFIVDQFESTFFQPDIFSAYEAIASIIYKLNLNLYFFLARKNDQLTTYDNTLISLLRLNSISQNFELRDFTKDESKILLDKINDNVTKKISKEVLSYILEFAQGFPWLLKRTMAHILKLTLADNISKKQLIDTGLMLDDLFTEELEGLEEIEKEYLTRISSRLPADFHQLQKYFDEDPLLPKMLDKFTQVRLLRLSGITYDTYNDVFKEYLVYQKLPEFKHQFIFRLHPNSVLDFFEKIARKNKFTIEQLSKSTKTSQKTLGNYIKECRNLNLIKREDEYWVVPKNIQDIYLQGSLGEYIRRQLLTNDLISNLLVTLAKESITIDDLRKILRTHFPYVEASLSTWNLYSSILVNWLVATKIINMNNKGEISASNHTKDTIVDLLGNLSKLKYGRKGRGATSQLLPSVSWSTVLECYELLKSGNIPDKGELKKAYIDLKKIDIDKKIDELNSVDDFKRMISAHLQDDEFLSIWESARNNGDIASAVKNLIKFDVADDTLHWRIKRILSWGKGLGLIENKRYQHSK